MTKNSYKHQSVIAAGTLLKLITRLGRLDAEVAESKHAVAEKFVQEKSSLKGLCVNKFYE